jgi:putative ABC transport system permease protein
MKYSHLLFKNLFRKKTRTLLTVGSFAVAMFLFGLLAVVRVAFQQGANLAGANRLVVINKTSIIQPLPISYSDRLKQIPGVTQTEHSNWFGGVYQDERNFFAQMAVEDETFFQVFPEFIVAPDQMKAYMEDREGAVVGEALMKRFGWKLGDRVPLKGTIFPGTWEFNIRAVYHGKDEHADNAQFLFHYKYLEEKENPYWRGQVGWYTVTIDNPDNAATIARKIDDTFANSPWETKTETEKAFATDFAKQAGNIEFLILSIGGVVFFTLLLVTGNTMAIAVRERIRELAVLKAVGYSDRTVLMLVLAESLVISMIGAALGLSLVKLMTMGGDPTHGLLPIFYLPTAAVAAGVVVALAIGMIAGTPPAVRAMRLRVVDALRSV